MILTCPSCATRYLIDPTALGVTGRVVRCARCSHSWTELPPEDMPKRVDVIPPPEAVRPIPPGSNLPALRDPGGKTAWIGWAALVVVIAGALAGGYLWRDRVIAEWPEAARLYAQLGLDEHETTRGLDIRNVDRDIFVQDEHTVVVVTGEVVNTTGRRREVPRVVIQIMNKDGGVIETRLVKVADSELAPGESTTFSDRFTYPPQNAVQLNVWLESGG